jgi:CarD family transcriptional regulator
MAARKKVTKKDSKALETGGSARSKRTQPRAQASEAKPTRAAARKVSQAAEDAANKSAAGPKKGAKLSAGEKIKKPEAALEKAVTEAMKSSAPEVAPAPKAADALKTVSKAQDSKPTFGNSKESERRNQTGDNPARARNESAPAAGLTGTVAKTPAAEAGEKPAPRPAVSPSAQSAAKTAKASPPTKPSDREPTGGEQKTMKNSANRHGFKLNEFVVYPAHGVGQIVAMEEQEVAGFKLELFVINFVKDKMTLRVPTSKVTGVGMRKLSDPEAAKRSLDILTGRARVKRTMWSRRAQEYEAKINSGDINAIAEVVRDLYRSEAQPEQSYSERQLYEAALDRMMREIAAVQKLSETEALKVIDAQLKKNTKRGVKADGTDGEDVGVEEAA